MKKIIALILIHQFVFIANTRNSFSIARSNYASNGVHNTTTQDYYFGVFAEKWDASASAFVGHAFIGIGKGTPLTCDINGNETEIWGFYPQKKIEGAKSYWFGPVDGKIASDIFTKIDRQFFVKIDFADYLKVQLKIEEWKKKKYELTRNDCISFLIDICNTMPDRVIAPDREPTDLPDEYVKKLINQNK